MRELGPARLCCFVFVTRHVNTNAGRNHIVQGPPIFDGPGYSIF